jgi:TolA-binding protein
VIRSNIANKSFFALVLTGLLVFIAGCSTKRNTFVTRTFHNTTARFNGYFYANESVKEGVARLEKNHKDDFTQIIPVFIYPTPDEAKGLFPDMDKAIKKLSLVIQRHTITTKSKKEIPGASKWIDDSYLLMGRAHFYKRDFFSGIESFDYVAKTYKTKPTRFKGMMWLIRSYDELGSISEAESLVDLLVEEKEFPKEYKGELAAIEAYHFILRENYGGALKPLNIAISLTKKKKLRARYMFIEAQLQQKMGKTKRASSLYSEVIQLNPNYELTFNSQINRARCFEVTSSSSGVSIKKELQKMLKDEKNTEYFDQIYYVLAEIAEKENDMPLCINYLKKSVQTSVSNNNQKAMAYLKLADISFGIAEYKPAQAYYDSTVSLIKPGFPNYDIIVNKKNSLSALVKNLNTIAFEDSLQRIAKMDTKERDAKIEKMILQLEETEKKKAEDLLAQQQQAQQVTQLMQQNTNTQNGAQWYFYNPTTVNFGATEFRKKWGDRKLEDNWRRASKELILDDGTSVTNPDAAASADTSKKFIPKVSNKKSKEYYLQDLPLTEGAVKRSDEKIVEAYYSLGAIYKEQLSNNQKSAESFEEMLKRYPENKYKLSAYYQLYRLYLAMNDDKKAEYYKNIFLTKYPETEYAKIIANPDYNKQKQANVSEAERLYTEAYQLYTDSNYAAVIVKCQAADTALGKSALMSKFDLLEALAIGRTQGIDAFEGALTRIVIKYPKDEVKNKAQEYLDLIKEQKSGKEKGLTDAKKDSLLNNVAQYLYNKDAEYYWVFLFDGPIDINKIKIELSNINSEYYSIDNLAIENILLDANKQMITVKSFTGQEKAMIYYNLISKDKKDIFSGLDQTKLKTFVISADNFPVFYKAKNIGDYMAFFQGNFLK